ncbi:nucleotide sugar dehydrogenase [Paraglaciecola sp. L3A3]|uniref:nucleotide sugar dehydrogenase n=1 Tax=Paraglaciecola sp. L3A3 TaxID=2686358 RepID=UPI00131D02E2|nr:nucleotide sugar dehydrogenase [Paraglaciecola sp. L3A3]
MQEYKIAVIGLGYVGLPLALEFGKHFPTYGYDTDKARTNSLKKGIDSNGELNTEAFQESPNLTICDEADEIKFCTIYIVTLPTPVGVDHKPDLSYLINASQLVGQCLKKGDLVIYESTVYPGATEDDCIPILCRVSNLKLNSDFGVGYSPERVNPGDTERPITQIVKVTSGSNPLWANKVDALYSKIILAGTFQVSSIKIAEAAKIIENTQRDLNIALINQLAQLFSVLKIDTKEVLDAASTKWNFIPFKPGLVGGHCISVDPYYLCHKAESVGYIPDIILAARRLNDSMGAFIANEAVKLLSTNNIPVHSAKIIIFGITFKENCGDTRNSKVVDIITELKKFNCKIEVHDPIADTRVVSEKLGIKLTTRLSDNDYDLAILAVGHDEYIQHWPRYKSYLKETGLVYDLKSVLPLDQINKRL